MPRIFVLLGTLGFGLGVILGEFHVPMFGLLGVVTVMIVVWSWTRRGARVAVLLVMLGLGVGRIGQATTQLDEGSASLLNYPGAVGGLVTRVSEQYGRQSIDLAQLASSDGRLNGGARLSTADIILLQPGDRLEIDCRWTALAPERLRRGQSQGLMAECRNPRSIKRLGPDRSWRGWLARSRGALVRRINQQYHHPQSDLLAGILLGVQESMSADLKEDFRATGTSHIVALSGFNVTIIITILSATLAAMIGRRLALWPTLGLIVGFVIMTGASASVTRAAVMAVVVMVAQQAGRPIAPSRLLSYACVGMTAVNPLVLRYDLGFQLSFLATIGLVYVSPLLEARLRRVPEVGGVRGNLSSTLAAMATTEPLLLWTFGRVSAVAPFVNLAVLPFIPLIMATGAVALIIPWAVPVTDALLRLVLGTITTAGSWSFAQVATPWWVAGGLAGLAGALVIHWATKTTNDVTTNSTNEVTTNATNVAHTTN